MQVTLGWAPFSARWFEGDRLAGVSRVPWGLTGAMGAGAEGGAWQALVHEELSPLVASVAREASPWVPPSPQTGPSYSLVLWAAGGCGGGNLAAQGPPALLRLHDLGRSPDLPGTWFPTL